MKYHSLFLVFATALYAAPPQTITVDDAHLQVGAAAKDAKIYSLTPTSSIRIDAEGYVFHLQTGMTEVELNTIMVAVGKEQYRAVWSVSTRVVNLGPDSLRSVNSGAPFPGFGIGHCVVAIGALAGKSFRPVWVGLVDVADAKKG